MKPVTGDRGSFFAVVVQNLMASAGERESHLSAHDPVLDNAFASGKLFGVAAAMRVRFNDLMDLAVASRMKDIEDKDQWLRRAFSTAYWAAEIDQADALREHFDFEMTEPMLLERVWLHGLAAREGLHPIVHWLAPWLLNCFAKGSAGRTARLQNDEPFRSFCLHLMRAQLERLWPTKTDCSTMGHYGKLVSTIAEPNAFRAALVEFCDQRIALSLGFDHINAPKRRSRSSLPITMLEDATWESAWPLELFSLRYVFESITGNQVSLLADHPLLMTPIMRDDFTIEPMKEDSHVERAKDFAAKVLGSEWAKLASVKQL